MRSYAFTGLFAPTKAMHRGWEVPCYTCIFVHFFQPRAASENASHRVSRSRSRLWHFDCVSRLDLDINPPSLGLYVLYAGLKINDFNSICLGPGPRPGLWKGQGMDRMGAPHEKWTFWRTKKYFDIFWPFLDLLDLKNESGSKFYTGKWYSEVWKRKIKLFHEKSTNGFKWNVSHRVSRVASRYF